MPGLRIALRGRRSHGLSPRRWPRQPPRRARSARPGRRERQAVRQVRRIRWPSGPASSSRWSAPEHAARDYRCQESDRADRCGDADTAGAVCPVGVERGSKQHRCADAEPATRDESADKLSRSPGPAPLNRRDRRRHRLRCVIGGRSRRIPSTNGSGLMCVPSRISNSVNVFDASNARAARGGQLIAHSDLATIDVATVRRAHRRSPGSGVRRQPWPTTPRRRGRLRCESTAAAFLRCTATVVARRPPFADTDASQCADALYALIHRRLAAGFNRAYRAQGMEGWMPFDSEATVEYAVPERLPPPACETHDYRRRSAAGGRPAAAESAGFACCRSLPPSRRWGRWRRPITRGQRWRAIRRS